MISKPSIILLAAGCALTLGCGPRAPAERIIERAALAMGSELRLSAWTDDESLALQSFEAVFKEFDRLDALMSVWRENSDVQRINDAAGLRPVPVATEVREVLRAARQVGDWTSGKFDVTFGALSSLWKFDHDQDNQVPEMSQVRARLPLVNYQAIEVDERAGTVFLPRAGMRVHLGGIGKGYAVDRAAALLRAAGLSNFMIQAGGDLYVAGRRGDRPWRVGIRDPRGAGRRTFVSLDLENGTFSTSGDYERYFIKDGRRFHHILDPDLGEPASGCRSVTIITNHAVMADALSTGVFVLGPAEGMALIERLPSVEGVIVTASNDVVVSSGLKGRLVAIEPPTDAP